MTYKSKKPKSTSKSEFIEENVVKLDWLNQNEVNFFFKCETDNQKYEKILELAADLNSQKV